MEANKKVADLHGITLDLRTDSYKPYKKPNDTISYIQCQSNHPPSIIKNLPEGIEKRLSNNSAKADIFQEAAKPYNNVLFNNEHKEELKYTNKGSIQSKRGKTPNDSDPKIFEPPKNYKNNNKKEGERLVNPPPPPRTAKTLPPILIKKNSLHYSALASNQTKKLYNIINKHTIKLS